jgi:hypothetical protein
MHPGHRMGCQRRVIEALVKSDSIGGGPSCSPGFHGVSIKRHPFVFDPMVWFVRIKDRIR